MNRQHFLLTASTLALVAGLLSGCDKPASAPDATAATSASAPAATPAAAGALTPRQAYEAASKGTGFTTGPVMAANTVYVFFDPTCPHCAALWTSAKELQTKLKIVWMPIGLLHRSSEPQGATILASPDPVAAMNENETSVLARGAGVTVSKNLGDDILAKVKANTDIFRGLGAESVPLIVYRNGKTGEFGKHDGAVPAEQLAAMVGL